MFKYHKKFVFVVPLYMFFFFGYRVVLGLRHILGTVDVDDAMMEQWLNSSYFPMSRLFISSYALHRCIRCVHASHPVVSTSISDPIQPDINLDEDEDRDEEKKKFLRFRCCIAFGFHFDFDSLRDCWSYLFIYLCCFLWHTKNNLTLFIDRMRAARWVSQQHERFHSESCAGSERDIFLHFEFYSADCCVCIQFSQKNASSQRKSTAYIIKCCKMRTLRWGGTDGFGARSRAVINCSTSSVSHTHPTIKREEWKQTLKLDRCTSELFLDAMRDFRVEFAPSIRITRLWEVKEMLHIVLRSRSSELTVILAYMT